MRYTVSLTCTNGPSSQVLCLYAIFCETLSEQHIKGHKASCRLSSPHASACSVNLLIKIARWAKRFPASNSNHRLSTERLLRWTCRFKDSSYLVLEYPNVLEKWCREHGKVFSESQNSRLCVSMRECVLVKQNHHQSVTLQEAEALGAWIIEFHSIGTPALTRI